MVLVTTSSVPTTRFRLVPPLPLQTLQAAGVYENSFIEGGGGDDTIVVKGLRFSLDLSATTIQGSQGNDQVHISTDGTAKKLNLFAGGVMTFFLPTSLVTVLLLLAPLLVVVAQTLSVSPDLLHSTSPDPG